MRDLAVRATTARDTHQACRLVAETLAENPQSIPFASVYLFDEARSSASLAATAGVPDGSTIARPLVQLSELPRSLADAAVSANLTFFDDLTSILGPLPAPAGSAPGNAGVLIPILIPAKRIGWVRDRGRESP